MTTLHATEPHFIRHYYDDDDEFTIENTGDSVNGIGFSITTLHATEYNDIND